MADNGWVQAQASDQYNIQIDFSDIEKLRDTILNHQTRGDEVMQKLRDIDQQLKQYWDSIAHDQFSKEIDEYEATFKQLITNTLTYIGDILAGNVKTMATNEEAMKESIDTINNENPGN